MKVEYVFKMKFVVEEKSCEEAADIEAISEEFKREFAADGDLLDSSFDVTRTVL